MPISRLPIVAGNWKMNTTIPEGLALVDAMMPALQSVSDVERVVCPPFPSLPAIRERLKGTDVRLGAQNVHWEAKGAFTGEVAAPMLSGLVEYVIIGHSERRQYFCETDETVARKVRTVLAHGLKPIMCVGENLQENEAGLTRDVVGRQVRAGLSQVQHLGGLVIAYEPVWAIGTGRAATGVAANEVAGFIRQIVAELFGSDAAQATRIQYGGSVTPENFREFISQPEIDGALVGGASLKADAFVEIVRQAARAKG